MYLLKCLVYQYDTFSLKNVKNPMQWKKTLRGMSQQ